MQLSAQTVEEPIRLATRSPSRGSRTLRRRNRGDGPKSRTALGRIPKEELAWPPAVCSVGAYVEFYSLSPTQRSFLPPISMLS